LQASSTEQLDQSNLNIYAYCMGQAIPHEKKKTFHRHVLKLRANEASAQGLQNEV
jgi:hypothetical protein